MNFEQLSEIIKERRSVFPQVYNDKPLSRTIIERVLENANWAPTHRKTEPWRWKVFTGDGLQKLSDYLGEYYTKNTPPERYSDVKYRKTCNKPLQSQAVIAICMHNDPSINIPEWEEVAAVAMAVQNIWLSCTALGIGSYWSSPPSALDASDFLQLPTTEKCLGWFYMGYFDPMEITSQRGSAADKTTWL